MSRQRADAAQQNKRTEPVAETRLRQRLKTLDSSQQALRDFPSQPPKEFPMSRFSITLIRLATLALLGSAGSAAYAQQTIDQNQALAGNVTPGDTAGFPITISQPGHYKLISNLNVPAGSKGILITAKHVTLDLNGFTVSGPGTCSWNSSTYQVSCSQAADWTVSGIEIGAGAVGAVIQNGTVRGFAGAGIFGPGQGQLISGLRVLENGGDGVSTGNDFGGAVVRNSFAEFNRGSGFFSGSMVVSSTSQRNGGTGFRGNWLIVHDSFATLNAGGGVSVAALKGTVVFLNKQANVLAGTSMGGNLNGNVPF
jgi:hypothetical protein